MIPKTIHYCWFGGNPLPASARKCINSWKKFFPEYEIKEWNETNYDVNKIEYIKQAYEARKYAFVSDYARFDILYQEGGIYFDTDVEVIKSFEDILSNGAFMGCEVDGSVESERGVSASKRSCIYVNPGLGMAASPKLQLFKEILEFYSKERFLMEDGTLNTETVVTKVTRILAEHGLKNTKGIQQIAGITVYPKEYFNPRNNNTGELTKTEKTHSIHWYDMTWLSKRQIFISRITRICHRWFGEECFEKVKCFLGRRNT